METNTNESLTTSESIEKPAVTETIEGNVAEEEAPTELTDDVNINNNEEREIEYDEDGNEIIPEDEEEVPEDLDSIDYEA